MIPGRWFITPHAVRQYIRRVRHHLNYEQALAELIWHSQTAHYVKETHGSQLWRTGKPMRLRLIVGVGIGEFPALVTVLPGHDVEGA